MTPKMKAALDFIQSFMIHNDGVSPTFDEMATGFGLASKCGVNRLLGQLERDGHIVRAKRQHRSIRIIDGPTRHQMEHWSSAELNRVRIEAYEILDRRLGGKVDGVAA